MRRFTSIRLLVPVAAFGVLTGCSAPAPASEAPLAPVAVEESPASVESPADEPAKLGDCPFTSTEVANAFEWAASSISEPVMEGDYCSYENPGEGELLSVGVHVREYGEPFGHKAAGGSPSDWAVNASSRQDGFDQACELSQGYPALTEDPASWAPYVRCESGVDGDSVNLAQTADVLIFKDEGIYEVNAYGVNVGNGTKGVGEDWNIGQTADSLSMLARGLRG